MNNLQQEIIIKAFRQQVSEVLVKWGMGTKQVAILEIVRAHEKALEAVYKEGFEEGQRRQAKFREWYLLGYDDALKEEKKI